MGNFKSFQTFPGQVRDPGLQVSKAEAREKSQQGRRDDALSEVPSAPQGKKSPVIAGRTPEAPREQSSGRRRAKLPKRGPLGFIKKCFLTTGAAMATGLPPAPQAWRRLEKPAVEGGQPGHLAVISQQRESTRKQGLPPPPPVDLEKGPAPAPELRTTWRQEVCNYLSAKPGIACIPASSVITRFQEPLMTRPLAL